MHAEDGSWLLKLSTTQTNNTSKSVSLAISQSAAFLACFIAGNTSVINDEAIRLAA